MDGTATQPEAGQQTPAVSVRGLSLHFDDRLILKDIAFDIAAGHTVSLLGANGAGKSTLLRVLATLLRPSHGQLALFGHPAGPTALAVRARVGVIAHQSMLYGDLTVAENLQFFGELYGVRDAADRARQMMDRVGMTDRADDAVKRLSRGMTQRVSIARALMHDPDLLLADEPFNGLDATSSRAMEALLRRLRSEGKTIIMANHDLAQSLRLADTTLVLRRGELVLNAQTDGLCPESVLQEMTGPC